MFYLLYVHIQQTYGPFFPSITNNLSLMQAVFTFQYLEHDRVELHY